MAALLGLFGGTQGEVQTVDPKTIYYSISTIADEIGPLEPVEGTPTASDVTMHEDDWRQIEFFPSSRLAELQRTMEQLTGFEAANRHGQVFRNVFVRYLPPALVLKAPEAVSSLAHELGVEARPGPILVTTSSITGRVAPGFALELPGNVALYGRADSTGITVLGADVGQNGDHETLARAFMKLNAAHGLIAVDWRSHMILTGVSSDGDIQVWSPQ